MTSRFPPAPIGADQITAMLGLNILRKMRGMLREASLWPATFRFSKGPAVAFLPSKPRAQSSLLRVYAIAEALKGLGWSTVVLPAGLDLAQRQRLLARFAPDVIVMQGARHALNRPDLHPGHRIAYDMDDADFHLPQLAEAVRDAMAKVDVVLAGSRYVADWCEAMGATAHVVWTGTPVSPGYRPRQSTRPPVVAWAQSEPVNYVLERAFVLDVMQRVARRRPGVRLRFFGRRATDNEDILAPFIAAGVTSEWLPMMPYAQFLRSLDDVAVGLSPICPENAFSRGKSFGKVLAYLDRGVPVVASDAADHPLFFTPQTGILSNDPAVWSDAIDRLLGDAAARQSFADAGLSALKDRLSTEAAARTVDAVLRDLTDRGKPTRDSVAARRPARSGRAQNLTRARHF